MQLQTILGQDEARGALDAMLAEISRRGKSAVVAVSDSHGELIALLRMNGAPLASIQIASNKAFTAARERKPSRELGARARDPERGFSLTNFGDLRYVGWGGGLPVILDGQVVGAVAVSGLSEAEDEEVAEIGRRAILSMVSAEHL